MPIDLDTIVAAQSRIAGAVAVTPCPESIPLSELTGCRIFCKLDHLQRTGSFKERGARNALMQLGQAARDRGVIAASAGNHALGLSYHGKLLGIPVTVVMPVTAPLVKVSMSMAMGARVIQHGDSFGEARAKADELSAAEGMTYVHGYDDPAIIAGQGTLGLEVLDQVPEMDAIIVPLGGCGLMAGVAVAFKTRRPGVRIIGVEATHAPAFSRARAAGHPVTVRPGPTLADGLAVSIVGENAFSLCNGLVDEVVQVQERDIALAILRLVELEKSVVEGAAAATLAALLSGKLASLAGKTVTLVLGGGNIDPAILSRVIEKGLAVDGRLCRFTAVISDRPGGLAAFASAVAATGASIKEVTHERAFSGPDVSSARLQCTIETRGHPHVASVMDALKSYSARLVPADMDY
ncbi:MAG: threonine dehydratase [Phycisphaerales bacterium]|nr:threonine dehydratase [Phycisphaerales bacterium]